MKTEEILLTLIQGEEGKLWSLEKKGWSSDGEPYCEWDGIICSDDKKQELVAIFLPKSGLIGTIPSEIGLLTTLKGLTISQGKLRGPIPIEIAKLPNLELLNLSRNTLTGHLPSFISKRLRSFNVGHNHLSGTLPPDYGAKTLIEDFDVTHNIFTGKIPSSLQHMRSIVSLSLSNNRFTGTIPPEIGQIPYLENLYLDNNHLVGTVPPAIARVESSLVQLWLHENMLSGTIPASLADVPKLRNLYVDGNKFTGTVPLDLCRPEINEDFFENVDKSVKRDYCQSIACPVNTVSKEGVFPCIPCSLKYFNPYLGRIGECIDMNQRDILQTLYHDANGKGWKGEFHWDVEDYFLCDFEGVTCDSNNHVVSINLKNRGLKGTIPESLGFLQYLNFLDLSDNELTGFLPSDLRWAPLQVLDISGNHMKGEVPIMMCQKSGVNENGKDRDYNCDNIACPLGFFSEYGRAGNGVSCSKCSDNADMFLGLKQCNDVYWVSHISQSIAFVTFCFVVLFMGSLFYFLARKEKTRQRNETCETEIEKITKPMFELKDRKSNSAHLYNHINDGVFVDDNASYDTNRSSQKSDSDDRSRYSFDAMETHDFSEQTPSERSVARASKGNDNLDYFLDAPNI